MEFSRIENGGYSPAEVDAYIAKVSQHYSELHQAYTGQQGQIERLTQEAQSARDEAEQLSAEVEKLRKSNTSQMPVDTNVIAKLMLDAELFAKQVKEESVAAAEKRLSAMHSQVRVLELQKEAVLDSLKQMAKNLTVLTGGKYEDNFTGENQPGIYKGTETQDYSFAAGYASESESAAEIDDFLARSKAALSAK